MPISRSRTNRPIGGILFALALALLVPNAYAVRKGTIDQMAAALAPKLASRHIRGVAVCTFTTDSDDPSYALGTMLSSRFTAALASHLPRGVVFTRTQLAAALRPYGVLSIDLDREPVCRIAAVAAHAQALVTGSWKVKDQGTALELEVSAVQEKGWKLGGSSAKISMDSKMRESLHQPAYDSAAKVYLPGSGGVSSPNCQDCKVRGPKHPREPSRGIILCTVTAEGTTAGIVELGHFGKDVRRAFLQSIRHWRFQPAHLRDGTPVAVRFSIVATQGG